MLKSLLRTLLATAIFSGIFLFMPTLVFSGKLFDKIHNAKSQTSSVTTDGEYIHANINDEVIAVSPVLEVYDNISKDIGPRTTVAHVAANKFPRYEITSTNLRTNDDLQYATILNPTATIAAILVFDEDTDAAYLANTTHVDPQVQTLVAVPNPMASTRTMDDMRESARRQVQPLKLDNLGDDLFKAVDTRKYPVVKGFNTVLDPGDRKSVTLHSKPAPEGPDAAKANKQHAMATIEATWVDTPLGSFLIED